jgi:hypothetical protein
VGCAAVLCVGGGPPASLREGVLVAGRAVGRTGTGVAVGGTGVLVGATARGCEAPELRGALMAGGAASRAFRWGCSVTGPELAVDGSAGAGVPVAGGGGATAGWASPRMTASTVLSGVGWGIDLPSLE